MLFILHAAAAFVKWFRAIRREETPRPLASAARAEKSRKNRAKKRKFILDIPDIMVYYII